MAQTAKTEAAAGPADETRRDNLRLWKYARETNPNFTKPANFGRKMTAIDSYYQIMRATELFGPFGQGWGYVLEDSEIDVKGTPMAKVKMILWYMDEDLERVQCSPIIAMNRMVSGDDNKADEEAFKKATTDALTKSLSYLGFSADIFMGMFDDNRYVDQLRKKYGNTKAGPGDKEPDQPEGPKIPKALADAIAEVKTIKAQDAFVALKTKIRPEFERLTDTAAIRYVALQFRMKELELWPDMPDQAPSERMADAAA